MLFTTFSDDRNIVAAANTTNPSDTEAPDEQSDDENENISVVQPSAKDAHVQANEENSAHTDQIHTATSTTKRRRRPSRVESLIHLLGPISAHKRVANVTDEDAWVSVGCPDNRWIRASKALIVADARIHADMVSMLL